MKKIIAIALVLILTLSLSVAVFAAGTKVYCATDWEKCYVYTWNADGSVKYTGEWPGTEMTKVDGLWEYEVPAGALNIIFNNGSGTQTDDLSMPTDNKVKYDVAGKTWSEKAVEVDPAPVTYVVAGSASICGEDWNASSTANAMTQSGSEYVKEFANVKAGEHSFKVTDGTNWWGNEAAKTEEMGSDNIVLNLTADGKVTVKFNPTTKVVTVIADGKTTTYGPEGSETEDPGNDGDNENNDTSGERTLTVKVPASWTDVRAYTWEPADLGDFPGAVLTKSGDVYKASIKKSMVNLVISGIQPDTTRMQTADIVLETNGKAVSIEVKEDGTYTIAYDGVVVTPPTTENRKPAADTPQGPLSIYRVVGNAAWMGSWAADSNLGQMVDLGNGVYRKNFENVEPGSYELKITKDGKWDNAYGVNGQNYTFTVDQKCTITVDFKLVGNDGVIEVYGTGVPVTADIPMMSVVILLALASVTAIILVVNKKKFI